MTGPRRNQSKRQTDVVRYVTYCGTCDKYAYASGSDAKKAHRQHFPGANRLSAYECPSTPDGATPLFHFGHMPQAHVAGEELDWWSRGVGPLRPTTPTPRSTP